MIIVYFSRMAGTNADISYNTAWAGIWVFAEVSFGIIVTSTLFLPKFIEAEGTKLKNLASSLWRPFTSFTSEGSFGILSQSNKHSNAAQEVPLDTVRIIGRSEGDLSFTNPEQDIERNLSCENVHNPARYPCVHSTDTPHHVQRR